ncbi:MAG TPA: hypothetical protein VF286_11885 [Acidiphilium sp.]
MTAPRFMVAVLLLILSGCALSGSGPGMGGNDNASPVSVVHHGSGGGGMHPHHGPAASHDGSGGHVGH